MTKMQIQQGALALAPQERLEIAETLLESLNPDDLPLYPWQREILHERVTAADARPEEASPWPKARARIEKRLGLSR